MGSEVTNVQAYPYTAPAKGGHEVFADGREFVAVYTDGGTISPATVTAGDLVQIRGDSSAASENNPVPFVVTSVSNMAFDYGVAMTTETEAAWMWLQVKGDCDEVNSNAGSAITIGDYVKAVAGQTYVQLDHATVPTLAAVGVALEANASGTSTIKVHLLGWRAVV